MNIYGSFFLRLKIMALAAIVLTGSVEAKVILINLFEVPQGKEKEAISMWETARDFLKTQPGYITTQLHEALDESSHFKLINIAEWDNIENFKAATEAMKKSGKVPVVEGLKGNPSLYKVIRTDK